MFAAATVGICLVGQWCMAASRMPPALASDSESSSNKVASPTAASSHPSASKMEEGCVPVNCTEREEEIGRHCCYSPVSPPGGNAPDRPSCSPVGATREQQTGSCHSSGESMTSGLDETALETSSPRLEKKRTTLVHGPTHHEQVHRIERSLEAVQRRQFSLKKRFVAFRRHLASKRRALVEDNVRRKLDTLIPSETCSKTSADTSPSAIPHKVSTLEPPKRQEPHAKSTERPRRDVNRRLERFLDERRPLGCENVCGEASRDDMAATLGSWSLRMRRMERDDDEEATESETSASDVDSEEETEPWSESKEKTSMRERHKEIWTEWRRDCAALSSRWHWLQQRITDLEQSIRRQTDVCETIRSTKQHFRHEDVGKHTPPLIDTKPPAETKDCLLYLFVPSDGWLSNSHQKNGLLLKLSNNKLNSSDDDCGAARTRALVRQACRRVVRREGDGWGRRGGVVERDDIVHCDSSFHHKLSVNTDIPIPLLLESSLRQDRWRQTERKRKSSTQQSNDKKKTSMLNSASMSGLSEKLTMRDRSVSAPSTPRPRSNSVVHDSRLCRTEIKKRYSADDGLSTSLPASSLSNLLKQQRRRPMSSAYDINNIIIPNSFASTTRVERLQYKDIVTPKWRDVSRDEDVKKNHQMKGTNGVSVSPLTPEIEDVSDEAFTQRHAVAEQAERKRFMAWNKMGTALTRHNTTSSSTSMSPTTPITPSTPDDDEHQPTTTYARRVFRRLSSTYDRWQDMLREAEVSIVPLFPIRTFPLSDDVYKKMIAEGRMPVEHSFIPSSLISTRAKMYNSSGENTRGGTSVKRRESMSPTHWDSEESYAPSPLSVADLSDTEAEQNQWAVVSLSEKPQEAATGADDSSNCSIVIKLTKR